MKRISFVVAFVALLVAARPAAASSITVLVGDKDWFGTGSSANVANTLLDGALRDARSSVEQGASNGAQLTDIYSALYPTIPWGCDPASEAGCTPNGSTGFVSFPLTNSILQSGTVSALLGGFQSTQFGPMLVNINGVSIPFSFDDGYQGTSLWSLPLSQQMIDAANVAGEVRINFDHSIVTCDQNGLNCKGIDYIAFDYFQLDAQVAPVPEPGTMVLVGLGLAGSALAARRRPRI